MHLRSDVGLAEMTHELRTRDSKGAEIDVDHVKVPSVATMRGAGDGAQDGGQGGEGLVVGGGEGSTVDEEAVELGQLAEAEGAVDGAGAIVVA